MIRSVVNWARRILATQNLQDLAQEAVSAQYFQMATQDCPWLKNRAFSPGGWAMNSLGLLHVFRVLNDVQPKNILEFGLGQSSKLVHQWAAYSNALALTIEHDQNWIDYFMRHVGDSYPIRVKRVDTEAVEVCGQKSLSYDSKVLQELQVSRFDCIFVDGPFGADHFARPQILDFVPQSLSENFCIFMHDSQREGEQETLNLICDRLSKQNIAFHRQDYASSQGHTIICSDSWKFLTSL